MSTTDPSLPRHPVRLVALKSGLSPHVLRAWERRYQVVKPGRSEGGQRLYSDRDVDRLRLLRQLTERGHSISRLASVPLEELRRLILEEEAMSASPVAGYPETAAEDFRAAALQAARRLDSTELQAVLERAAVTLGVPAFLEHVAAPTIHAIGEGWSQGTLAISHEHLATATYRRVLSWILEMFEVKGPAPRILVATPPRQLHELGAMLAAATAASEGWAVTYLGPDLPVPDLLSSVKQVGARAVALSIVYAAENGDLFRDLEQTRRGLDPDISLFLGGSAVAHEPERFAATGGEIVSTLPEFRAALRATAAPPS